MSSRIIDVLEVELVDVRPNTGCADTVPGHSRLSIKPANSSWGRNPFDSSPKGNLRGDGVTGPGEADAGLRFPKNSSETRGEEDVVANRGGVPVGVFPNSKGVSTGKGANILLFELVGIGMGAVSDLRNAVPAGAAGAAGVTDTAVPVSSPSPITRPACVMDIKSVNKSERMSPLSANLNIVFLLIMFHRKY